VLRTRASEDKASGGESWLSGEGGDAGA